MAKISPSLDAKPRTQLYPWTRDVVADFDRVIQERVTQWVFFHATESWSCVDFHGKRIAAGGCRYEGSIRETFWRYADPFLENAVRSSIATLLTECERRRIDVEQPLAELQDLLHRLGRRTFGQMVEVDRRLRGQGYPRSVEPENVVPQITAFSRFVDDRIVAAGVRNTVSSGELLSLRPGLWGISVDLRQVWRRVRERYQARNRGGAS